MKRNILDASILKNEWNKHSKGYDILVSAQEISPTWFIRFPFEKAAPVAWYQVPVTPLRNQYTAVHRPPVIVSRQRNMWFRNMRPSPDSHLIVTSFYMLDQTTTRRWYA